jgi:D-sedoheptulose 7-phosphate isomerase
LFRRAFEELTQLIANGGPTVVAMLEHVAERAVTCLNSGGKILVAGNGGSAAEAQHFAAELVGRYLKDRAALPAVALTCDTSTLTAVGNDYGFDRIFERQIEALAQPCDLLLLLSTSGNSPNLIAAASKARQKGCAVVAFTGAGGGNLANNVDALLAVPSRSVPRIQEMHLICLHLLAGHIESKIFGKNVS